MSDFVVHKGIRAIGTFKRSYGSVVEEIQFSEHGSTIVSLSDGRSGAGTCLGCGDAPCMYKAPSELSLFGLLESFPGDPSLDVCPTRALQWNAEKGNTYVVVDDCIGCGLCVSRCPYGAISLKDGLTAFIETDDPDNLADAPPRKNECPRPKKKGKIASLDAQAAKNLPYQVSKLQDTRANLLVRNLLNEIGLNARIRRRGDTNMRIDVVGFSRNEKPFVAEIEFHKDALESPRFLLEDVAILHSRYGFDTCDIDPISILLTLPNVRSEYYQVMRDIEKVVGLQCRTITIGVLIALLWSCSKLQGFDEGAFVIGEGMLNLSDSIAVEQSYLLEPYPGAFTPVK